MDELLIKIIIDAILTTPEADSFSTYLVQRYEKNKRRLVEKRVGARVLSRISCYKDITIPVAEKNNTPMHTHTHTHTYTIHSYRLSK